MAKSPYQINGDYYYYYYYYCYYYCYCYQSHAVDCASSPPMDCDDANVCDYTDCIDDYCLIFDGDVFANNLTIVISITNHYHTYPHSTQNTPSTVAAYTIAPTSSTYATVC